MIKQKQISHIFYSNNLMLIALNRIITKLVNTVNVCEYQTLSFIFRFLPRCRNLLLHIARQLGKKNLRSYISHFPLPLRNQLFGLVSNGRPRRYLRPNVTVYEFFEHLNRHDCNYVVLRWWELILDDSTDEDIDMLICDDDFSLIYALTVPYPTPIALDVYTIYGTHGGRFADTPYFPIELSLKLLTNRRLYNKLIWIPNPMAHFLSLIYHAMFHKLEFLDRGSAGSGKKDHAETDHNYPMAIETVLETLECKESLKRLKYAEILESFGCYPPPDVISMLSRKNRNTLHLYPRLYSNIRGLPISLFIIRESALMSGMLTSISTFLEDTYMFEIVASFALTEAHVKDLSFSMRGMNWGNGPYPNSGGLPAYALVVIDYYPQPVTSQAMQRVFPCLTNVRFHDCKLRIRELVNAKLGYFKSFNPIHSTDNEYEALWYLKRITTKQRYDDILAKISLKRSANSNAYPLVKTLSQGRRSKVELICYNQELAVKKTFRNSATFQFNSELLAYRTLSKSINCIPRLLYHNANYIITTYSKPVVLPANSSYRDEAIARSDLIVRFLYDLWSLGYAHMNFTPNNVLLTADGIQIIDFEFLYHYCYPKPSFSSSFDIVGPPQDFMAPIPHLHLERSHTFFDHWPFMPKNLFKNFVRTL